MCSVDYFVIPMSLEVNLYGRSYRNLPDWLFRSRADFAPHRHRVTVRVMHR